MSKSLITHSQKNQLSLYHFPLPHFRFIKMGEAGGGSIHVLELNAIEFKGGFCLQHRDRSMGAMFRNNPPCVIWYRERFV